MHRKIAAAVAALVLFAGPSTLSFALNPSGTPTVWPCVRIDRGGGREGRRYRIRCEER